MSLIGALSTGTTGLASSSQELTIIGDNIANANTTGFKAGRAAFEDALAQSVVGGAGSIGLGSRLQAVQKILTQGALSATGLATDLALQGSGFFVVRGNHLGATANFYTRDGQFTVDRDGYLVNLDGLRVQGFPADATGAVQGIPGDLLVGTASAAPRASTTLTVKANLAADATIPALPWDPSNPTATSNHATTVTVYDSLGTAHQAQIFFRRTGAGQWEWHALTDGAGLSGGTPGTLTEIAAGTLAFDAQGRLDAVTQSSSFAPAGAAPQTLTFDFGDALGAGGTGLAGITQFASPSATTFVGQDGYESGQLASVRIDEQGIINGIFTNGQSRVLGQVAIADFPAADRLERTGGNLYQQTVASGQPVLGAAGTGGRASIVSGSLEGSNVDIAEQFVRMIAAQRAFQANSKTITTADQLLGELIALKR